MCENYKVIDRKKIMDYLATNGGEVDVKKIIDESGAEKMRVFPILFEERIAGNVEVTEFEDMGSPKRVRLKKMV